MPTLLIVHHTPSPSLQTMFEAVLAGATTDEIEDVELVRRPALHTTAGRPYGLYVHGGNDTSGAVRAVQSIAKGMGWQPAAQPVEITGEPGLWAWCAS